MEKILKSNKYKILCFLPTRPHIWKIKMSENFIDMVQEFGISKSTIVFKISLVKFVN